MDGNQAPAAFSAEAMIATTEITISTVRTTNMGRTLAGAAAGACVSCVPCCGAAGSVFSIAMVDLLTGPSISALPSAFG
ncbi:hypothetical protein GCM10009127_10100 [Alteraurantiacibacter aestuarii]